MDNGAITVEHSLAEQQPQVDNEVREKSAQNQSNSARFDNVIEKRKRTPMTPTALYIIFFSTQSS